MADIQPVKQNSNTTRTDRYLFEAMGDDDTGLPILVGERADGSIQVVGTFGGATVTLQGSNDGATWATLTDEASSGITFTATGLKMFLPRVWKIRVITAGGSATDVDAHLLLGS